MSYLSENFQATFDPLLRGHGTFDHMALGYAATRGLVLPATLDTVLLLRRRLYPQPESWRQCGMADVATGQVVNYEGFTHAGDMGYQYCVARCHANGFRSAWSAPIRVDFDGGGNLITPPLPMWPVNLVATPIAGGKCQVLFGYEDYGQGDWPKDFQVFEGVDVASINYAAALVDSVTGLDHVLFAAATHRFVFTTPAYLDGTKHVFGVRARNNGQVAELNQFTTSQVTARATGPAAATIRSITQRRVAV